MVLVPGVVRYTYGMNRILRRANVKLSLGNAAFLLASSSFLGVILGVIRTKAINSNFNNFMSGAYFAAFKIPDLIYIAFASGAISVAFMPVLTDKLGKGNRKGAWQLTSYVLNAMALVTFVMSLLLIIFARPLLEHVIAPGFSPERLDVATSVMRLVAINPLVFSIVSVLASVQQAMGRFFFFAIAPLFYNISIIASIYIFQDNIGIVGLGVGVAIGSLLNLAVVSLGMIGLNFKHSLRINLRDKSLRQVMTAVPPRSINQGITQINTIAETRFASRISISAVTNFENALVLHNAPVRLIGVAISTAAFPRFTERLSQGRPDLFRKEFMGVLKAMIWIAVPVVAASYFGRDYLARIIFSNDNREIAIIFGFLSISMFFRTIYSVITRYFYAQKDTKTPLYVSLFTIAFNVYLAYRLSRADAYGVSGLAIAASTTAALEVMTLLFIMKKRDHKMFDLDFFKGLMSILATAAFVSVGAFFFSIFLPLKPTDVSVILYVKISIIGLLTIALHIFVSWILGVEESKPVTAKIKKIILRPVKIN